ncbi:MAG: sulfatase [bacterium]|nr:sulfatase [bacterium]
MQRLALFGLFLAGLVGAPWPAPCAAAEAPNIILISVDTLRTDRMSGYGHSRLTSPKIDELLASGARFTEARTPAPLTAPAMSSVMTSLHPHEHGCTRNGLRVRPRLVSFSKLLERRGYRTAGFVGNWTLKSELSGLGEYFEEYEALLNRKRWFGMAKREATAEDISGMALEWLGEALGDGTDKPVLLWVHYVEPHAPYRLRREYLKQIGVKAGGTFFSARKRYDSEIAYVDDQIGRFLDRTGELIDLENTLIVFVADHGESLGEHGYWGHGRHLYDVTLRVPMGFVWPARIGPAVLEAPASILDIAPTVLSLVGLPVPGHFQGFDWAGVLNHGEAPSMDRVTWHQAHRSSVQPSEEIERLRQRGLLEVGKVVGGRKEVIRVTNQRRRLFELAADPGEKENLAAIGSAVSGDLTGWVAAVRAGLATADELPPPSLTDEDMAALKALGYID